MSVTPHRHSRVATAGFHLVDVLMTLAVSALIAAIAGPSLLTWHRALSVRMAASEVVGAMQTARLYAVGHQRHVALKFRTSARGTASYTLYRDGDGDGVRNDDIAAGRDPEVRAPRDFGHFGATVRFGFPPDIIPLDPGSGRPMTRLDDPIRFNNSDLASFTPLGTSTPGSVYITDGWRQLAAVRVDYRIGKMRVLVYQPEERRWRRR